MSQDARSPEEGGGDSKPDVGVVNALVAQILAEVKGIDGIAGKIKEAADTAVGAINTAAANVETKKMTILDDIEKKKMAALQAIEAAKPATYTNADNPNFQEPWMTSPD